MDIEEYKGHEVTVFIPAKAGGQVVDLVMDAVVDSIDSLEGKYALIYDRTDWDLFITSSPANHTTEAALDRALETIKDLSEALVGAEAKFRKKYRLCPKGHKKGLTREDLCWTCDDIQRREVCEHTGPRRYDNPSSLPGPRWRCNCGKRLDNATGPNV